MRTSDFVMQLIFFGYSFFLQLKAGNIRKPTCVSRKEITSLVVVCEEIRASDLNAPLERPVPLNGDVLQTG